MGEVFLSEDLRLGRKVVIKLLPEAYSSEPAWLRRFEQETCAVSALNHPNIMTVYGFWRVRSITYLATEHIDGRTLREMMAEDSLRQKRQSI
jgi:eukaryotic-like serine/threonine-protein kinase